jgi:ankyrin repeat protein
LDLPANDGRTALHIAVEHRNQIACESLLKAGASYLVRDNSHRLPIHIAVEEGHRSIALLLLECPIRDYGMDRQGRDLLHFLVMWHSSAFIRKCIELLQPDINVHDKCRRSPLHYAAIFGNSAAVGVLLEMGAKPNIKDNFGSTPIHYALSEGSLTSVQLLVNSGTDLNILDNFSRSALHLALRSENTELIDYIVKITKPESKGTASHVCHTDKFGQTVLHRACHWDHTKSSREEEDDQVDFMDLDLNELIGDASWRQRSSKIRKQIRVLRALGADVNAQDHNGFTPLHVASKSGNAIATDVLLSFPETETSIRDNKGFTPLDWAVVDGHSRMAEALSKRGGIHSVSWQTKLRPMYTPWVEDGEEEQLNSEDLVIATL